MPQNKKNPFHWFVGNLLGNLEDKNSICFDKKTVKSPSEIVCLASSFVSYWAGLHTQGAQQDLEEGAAAMREAALHFHQHHQPADQVDAGMVLLQSPVDGQDSGASLI